VTKKKKRRRPQPARSDRDAGRSDRDTARSGSVRGRSDRDAVVSSRARGRERTGSRAQAPPRRRAGQDREDARQSSARTREGKEAPTTPPVVQPPVAVSLVRGLTVVGRSPALLVSVFVGALLLWLTYSSSGVVRVASPGVMAQLESLPPVHSFLDIQFLVTASRVYSPSTTIVLGAALIVVRTALMSFWLAMILEGLTRRGRSEVESGQAESAQAESAQAESAQAESAQAESAREESARGDPASDESAMDQRLPGEPAPSAEGGGRVLPLAPVVRRAAAGFVPMLGVEAGFALLVYGFSVVLGLVLGPLGLIAGFVGSIYFLAYAPVVAMAERATPREAAKLASRAARIPGRQHMTFAVLYLLLAILLLSTTPSSPAAPSTPSILVWGYVLFVSYVHVSVLAAFAHRWLALREAVLAGPVVSPRPRRLFGSPR
jgi:hypothetical protein